MYRINYSFAHEKFKHSNQYFFMKKNLLSLTLCLLAFVLFGTLNAQTGSIYQLPNGGFEEWYREVPSGSNSANSIVPVGFNSFYSGSGLLIGTASAKRQDSSRDVRAGAAGIYSLHLYSTTVLTIRANGNVTTGRINAASMTASDQSNHNYTDYAINNSSTPPNPSKFCQEITGTPDSLRFWVKYLPGRTGATNTIDRGRIRVYIHGTGHCRDAPNYPAGMVETQLYYGKAMKEFFKEDGEWHCYQVPFEYNGTNDQRNDNGNYYVLLSMTTNAQPGGGANNPDRVWFDDIEFVYSAWLTDLKVHGATIDGFQKGLRTYGGPKLTGTAPYAFPYQPEDFSWVPESNKITNVTVTNVLGPDEDADGGYTSILITAQDSVTQVEYRIYYYTHRSDDNNITAMSYTIDGETFIPVPGFISSQTNYNITLTDPEEVRVPQIVRASIVLSDTTAEVQRIEQPTSVNSRGTVVVCAENLSLKSYNVMFSKIVSSNSKLNWIRIGGVDIADFHSDTLTYNHEIATCITAIPAITYERSSTWANISYTPATLTNRTATIVVTAEDDTQTIYTINFVLTNNDLSFTIFRISNASGTANNRDLSFVAEQTVYEHASSFTVAQNITPTWNCTSVTVNRVPASTVYYPDTNYFHVTAQDRVTTITYKIVIKNTNCFLATGNNAALRYNYHDRTNFNTGINITTTNNGNLNPVTTSVVTLQVGPNNPPELLVIGLAASAAAAPPTVHIQQPASRSDTAIVTLTANDGVTQKIYRVPFSPTLSTDANLSNLTSNGFQVPGFSPTTESYTLIIPSSVTTVPEVVATPSFQWLNPSNIILTQATNFQDTTKIEVTAENGIAKRTYRIAYEVVPQEKDAYLSDIRYENASIPGFNPTRFDYTMDIPYSAPTPPAISFYSSSPTALVFRSEQMNTPPYTQRALVYSQDMTVLNVYTVSFNLVKNTNAALADIKVNGVSLQEFDPQEFDYNYELPYTELNAPIVTATPAYEYAQVDIIQIDTVTGTVTINVTAENEAYTAVYTINFTRELSSATAMGTIIYEYNNQIYAYEVNNRGTEIIIALPVETEGNPVITNIILADNRAGFEIDEQPNATNDFTGTIIVTAEDLTEEIYSIIFEKTLSESTLLTGIYYNGIPVPNFDPEVSTYTIILPFNTSQIPNITATATWQGTNVTIQNPSHPFGNGTVTVTSEDGENSAIYIIDFQRKGNPRLVALSYNLDGTNIPVPGFDPAILTYNVTLGIGTMAVPVLEFVPEDTRCTIEVDQQDTPNGTSQIKLVTWNQDDSLTYTVNFTVTLSQEALLADLQVNGVTIPNFNEHTLNYVIEYEFGTVDLPEITAEATQLDATVIIEQIEEYPGMATITVIAGNTAITRTYTISFSVDPGNNTYLFDILVDGFPLQGFNKEVYFYEWRLPLGITELPEVDAIAEDATSIVTIHHALQIGDTAKIFVEALNGDIALYQIHFTTEKGNNAHLSNIFIDWEPLEGFVRYLFEYTHMLPENYAGAPFVVVELEDPLASFEMVWSYTIPLQLQIIVTAENGVTQSIYTIIFDRKHSVISFDNETEIQVYPNPSSDNIHFVISEVIQTGYLEIYSIENKRIGSHRMQSGANTINIEHLPKGIYLYRISTDNTVIKTGKFVKN